ncbi:MAG: hypothetical protein WBS24_03385 [Terriglobales bacterium]
MTRKTIYLLNIGDFAPELTKLTYPAIERWASRIGADIHVIRDRVFPDWPLTYEKLQIHGLARRRGDDWAIYIDSDALLHPELPDITEWIPRDTVAHNGNDWSPVRFDLGVYAQRDGRGIGSCNWFTVASSWCLDLWRPLELHPSEVIGRIHPTVPEVAAGIEAEHLVDDYALSSNIARFGLKFTTLGQLWRDRGLVNPDFFHHDYTFPLEDYPGVDLEGNEIMLPGKVSRMVATMQRWGV